MVAKPEDIYGIYGSVPDVRAEGGGGSPMGVRASPEDFGGQVGEATSKLGATGEEAVQQWGGLIAETQANQAELGYIRGQGELKAKYSQYEGLQAEQMRPKYEQESMALQQQYRNSLSPIAAKVFDSNTRRVLANDLSEYAGYSASQVKQANLKSNDDLADLQAQSAGNLPTVQDDQRFGGLLGNTLHAANAVADIKGWGAYSTGVGADGRMTFADTPEGQDSKAQYDAYTNQKLGQVYLTAAKTIADNQGAAAAGAWAEKHWNDMPDAAKVQLNQYLAPKKQNEAISAIVLNAKSQLQSQYNAERTAVIPGSPTEPIQQNPVDVIMRNEGGISPDGHAIYGIDKNAHPTEFAEAQKITAEKGQAAGQQYARDWYQKNIIDKYHIKDLPPDTQAIVADGLVNHGAGTFGQSLINAAKNGASPQQLIDMRRAEYQRLNATGLPQYTQNFEGWNNRLDRLEPHTGAATNAPAFYEAHTEEMVDNAKDAWYANHPGDWAGAQQVETRTRAEIRKMITDANGELKSDRDMINNAIGGAYTKGQPVFTQADLEAIPGMRGVLDRVRSEQPAYAAGIDNMIAKNEHNSLTTNSPNAYATILRTLSPMEDRSGIHSADHLAHGLASNDPAISITRKDYNEALPAIGLNPNLQKRIRTEMQAISVANGNIDGKGEQRAVQWYNTVMGAYKQNQALGDKKKSDAEFMQNIGEQYGPNPPSRMQQITNWAESLSKSHPTNTASSTIRVISPDGKTGVIPAAQLDEALKAGYKRAQ